MPAKVAHIEYDPNRTARIAPCTTQTVRSATSWRPRGSSGHEGRSRDRRRHQARKQPSAAQHPGGYDRARRGVSPGAAPARPPAGAGIQLVAREGRMATLSALGEMRMVDVRCRATVGEVGNSEQSNIDWGKAGRMRWKGVRPTVRGVAMNPVDHPHGGGEAALRWPSPGHPWASQAAPGSGTRPATSTSSAVARAARSADRELRKHAT